MGDLIQEAVRTNLVYVEPEDMQAALRAPAARPYDRIALFADTCRLNALYMIARAGSGHIGSSFSSLDIVSYLLLHELGPHDLYFSSKGHDAPGLYAALIGLGRLPSEQLHALRRLGGLPGHPDVATPGISANVGSLGMGISKAKGMVLAHRYRDERRRIFVLTGDGELQEGQIWESLQGAVHRDMGELTVIVDHNKVQSDRLLEVTSDLGALERKLASFGWHVERVDGHDIVAIAAAFDRMRRVQLPKILIADTIKGRGVSFMEHTRALSDPHALYRFHSGAPDPESYVRAASELRGRIEQHTHELRFQHVARVPLSSSDQAAQSAPERLIPAYGRALLDAARRDSRIVALDADLMVDMGLWPFAQALPERFVECGIAEMDMVSQAGGLALRGMLPVCHSFACFMTARANEQIFVNASERTKIVYTGGLAGLLPAGPGHSHQGLRDIALLSAIPGMTLLAPSDEREVALALDYALTHAAGSCYVRLCSVPTPLPQPLPERDALQPGRGVVARAGADATLIAYGPVMLREAMLAGAALTSHGISLQVIALPWLNLLDGAWLLDSVQGQRWLFTLDDHFAHGGQGDMIWSELARSGAGLRGARFGVEGLPACGQNDEVLRHHQLDAQSLCDRIRRCMAR